MLRQKWDDCKYQRQLQDELRQAMFASHGDFVVSSSVTVSRNSYFIPRNELTLQSLSSTEVHSIAIFVVLLHRALLPSKPRGTWMLDPLESLDISGDFEI